MAYKYKIKEEYLSGKSFITSKLSSYPKALSKVNQLIDMMGETNFSMGVAHWVWDFFNNASFESPVNEAQDNPKDVISVDVPLFIRLLEYAREDAQTDMDLHDVAENIITLSAEGKVLTMGDYDMLVGGKEQMAEEVNVGDTKIGKGIKSTVTSIDPETRAISWDIDYVPAYDTVFNDFDKLRNSIKKLAVKSKDSTVQDISDTVVSSFNKYRTHIRKTQPEAYKKFGKVDENEGGSVSNAAGGYLGKYAFKLPKKQKDIEEGASESAQPNAKNPGATLGAGPAATETGVKNNSYVKQFKYQLVKE